MTRRNLLEMAGGLSFLALVPAEKGYAFSGKIEQKRPPIFTSLPYIQPGPHGSTLREKDESIIIAWQTDGTSADYTIKVDGKVLIPTQSKRDLTSVEDGEMRFHYATLVSGLKLRTRYTYTVTLNGEKLLEGWFTTRKPRGVKTRFVAFGDNSFGDISDRNIAFQAYKAKPDFVMNTGDNVYESGTEDEYARHFFPVYNAEIASERVGAPLIRSVPFYTVIANHDVTGKDANKHPVVDFDKTPDGLGYFTHMHLPLSGMENNPFPVPLAGSKAMEESFRACAGARFPTMSTYSYDYGDAHFLCLDSNIYVNPNNKSLQDWIEKDLNATDAAWKFVVFHHPAFNIGAEHYTQQHMRVLSPIFEKCGVTMTFHGHEHNYQRTMPLKFAPTDTKGADNVGTKARLVPGNFTIDSIFDGKTNTKPNGVIYITTGAGGKHLYDPEMNTNTKSWQHAEDNNVAYIARFVSDRHSLTVMDMDAKSLTLTQIDQWGAVIDTCKITK
jgi:acid phosphatase type 7